MDELWKLLRESLPEALGGLIAAAVIALITKASGYGLVASILAAAGVAVAFIFVIWLYKRRRKPAGKQPSEVVTNPSPSSQVELQSVPPTETPLDQERREELIERLRGELDKLNDVEFREMIIALLSPDEQTRLTAPVMSISRGMFLSDMEFWGRLDQVEQYLHQHFSERFSR